MIMPGKASSADQLWRAWPAVPALAFIMWSIAAMIAPRTAVAGWLIGFVFVSAIPLGSLALTMIHRLTGGLWGDAVRPVLAPAIAVTPLLFLLFVPVMVAMPLLYPWWGDSDHVTASVAHLYLNAPGFIVRSLVTFIGWTGLALWLPRIGARTGLLLAALGILFHAVMMTLLSTDWILSVEPPFTSTSFGATLVMTQILAALAFAVLTAPNDLDSRARRDLAGLMLAVTLGVSYLNFMAVLVIWYGDLPETTFWFVERIRDPWRALAISSFFLASLLPTLALLLSRVRQSSRALRFVASSTLTGLATFVSWLLAPVFGIESLIAAALAIVAMLGGLTVATETGWLIVLSTLRRSHD